MCHGGGAPKGGLNLTTSKSYAALVGVTAGGCNDGRKRVEPGKPTDSYLIHKTMGVQVCSGNSMPPVGAKLSNTQIQTISDWICGGALDN